MWNAEHSYINGAFHLVIFSNLLIYSFVYYYCNHYFTAYRIKQYCKRFLVEWDCGVQGKQLPSVKLETFAWSWEVGMTKNLLGFNIVWVGIYTTIFYFL